MNPLVVEALGAIVRWVLTFGAGWLVQHGIWTQADAKTYVAAAAMGMIAGAWSLWSKYKGQVKFLTALEATPGTTPAQIDARIANGLGAKVAMILLAVALGGLALTSQACAHNLSPKVTIDVADRTAYAALRVVDVDEETMYHANASVITPAMHKQISAKISQAYALVIDVANLGVNLPAGAKLSAADLQIVGQLTQVVADVAALIPASNANLQADLQKFKNAVTELSAAISK